MTAATYEQVLDGLHTRFATLGTIKRLLKYEPTSIAAFPTLYSLLDNADYGEANQVKYTRYSILHRLVFRWQDNEQAELELMPYIDSLPATVAASRHLDGALNKGDAKIARCQGTFVTIGGALFRCLDFYSDVLSK